MADRLDAETRGPLLAPSDGDGRTLLMDFLAVEMGSLDGIPVRVHLVGLPGAEHLGEDTLPLLRGADGFVFVADSAPDRRAANRSALESLRRHLVATGQPDLPLVVQLNRRDVPGAVDADELASELLPADRVGTSFETVATRGDGVVEALTSVCSMVVRNLSAAAEERSGA